MPPVDFEEEKPASRIAFEAETPQRIPVPKLESFAHGAAQGATFGLVDEAAARLGAAFDVGQAALGQRGDISWDDAVQTRLKPFRQAIDVAQAENPWSFGLGQVAGNVATMGSLGLAAKGAGAAGKAAAKVNQFVNPSAAAGLGAKLKAGAALGALTGFGYSKSDLSSGRGAVNVAEDTLLGAGLGAGTAGALHAGGKALRAITPRNVAKKAANVVLGTPEEITETYIQNPQAVKSAPLRHELAREYEKTIAKLQGEVTEGSQLSRDILSQEGKSVRGSEIAKIMREKAQAITDRAEGVLDDPQTEAALAWLRDKQARYTPPEITDDLVAAVQQSGKMPGMSAKQIKAALVKQGTDRNLSTNRVKDLLQSIDRSTEFETAPGRFGRIDDRVKGDVRRAVDALLKRESPAYGSQMEQVAADTRLLEEAAPLAKNPGALANVLRRIETDQYGGGMFPRDVIGKVDERMGTKLLEAAKLSNAREAFDKSITNGSRNVNLFSNALKDVPVVGRIAPFIGGAVDKYGRKMTMAAVDRAVELNKILQQQNTQEFLRQIAPLVAAAKQGNGSAILTMQLLTQTNPEAARLVNEGR